MKTGWLIGLVIVAVSIVMSYIFSMGTYSDAPQHDLLFSIPLLAGILLMTVSAIIYAVQIGLRPKTQSSRPNRMPIVTALALTTALIGLYLFNPLVSPVTFLHDSDLDGVQDYSDDYPQNHSRVDYPWALFDVNIGAGYYTPDEWSIFAGDGMQSFWLDATAIEVLDEGNSTIIERTLLQDLGDEEAAEGVRYFNMPKTDRLDVGDYFLLDRDVFGEGSRLMLWIFDGSWWCCKTVTLRIP